MSIEKSDPQSGTADSVLYIVATPIGNLDDITLRAIEVLKSVDLIAAEDTRHSQRLLNHLGIHTKLIAYHEHNEQDAATKLIARLREGLSIALVSDAGTPLISDPGYRLVEQARQQGVRVVPVPGASALLAALCATGLPTDRFCFEGFLPAKQQARRSRLEAFLNETRSTVFYESCHRIVDCLQDMVTVFGPQRRIGFARELTKTFETISLLELGECLDWVESDANQHKGEIVLVLEGSAAMEQDDEELHRVLKLLIAELPLKQAASLAAQLTGRSRNECYQVGQELKDAARDQS